MLAIAKVWIRGLKENFGRKQTQQVVENTSGVSVIGQNNPNLGHQ
jgi:hypothetical protein